MLRYQPMNDTLADKRMREDVERIDEITQWYSATNNWSVGFEARLVSLEDIMGQHWREKDRNTPVSGAQDLPTFGHYLRKCRALYKSIVDSVMVEIETPKQPKGFTESGLFDNVAINGVVPASEITGPEDYAPVFAMLDCNNTISYRNEFGRRIVLADVTLHPMASLADILTIVTKKRNSLTKIIQLHGIKLISDTELWWLGENWAVVEPSLKWAESILPYGSLQATNQLNGVLDQFQANKDVQKPKIEMLRKFGDNRSNKINTVTIAHAAAIIQRYFAAISDEEVDLYLVEIARLRSRKLPKSDVFKLVPWDRNPETIRKAVDAAKRKATHKLAKAIQNGKHVPIFSISDIKVLQQLAPIVTVNIDAYVTTVQEAFSLGLIAHYFPRDPERWVFEHWIPGAPIVTIHHQHNLAMFGRAVCINHTGDLPDGIYPPMFQSFDTLSNGQVRVMRALRAWLKRRCKTMDMMHSASVLICIDIINGILRDMEVRDNDEMDPHEIEHIGLTRSNELFKALAILTNKDMLRVIPGKNFFISVEEWNRLYMNFEARKSIMELNWE
ncbi:hypothetical protein B0J11DRAFT_508051 [Dendryphion nanum]|uniref:Uncharacterized protein n=1 Tax=Dendryphion nanum TaxID=256645 RepID=A0A9P9DKU9_9PLEO|nr:hypothetical protein B0J11DRAFT_508051 [Dendryphion nanum]